MIFRLYILLEALILALSEKRERRRLRDPSTTLISKLDRVVLRWDVLSKKNAHFFQTCIVLHQYNIGKRSCEEWFAPCCFLLDVRETHQPWLSWSSRFIVHAREYACTRERIWERMGLRCYVTRVESPTTELSQIKARLHIGRFRTRCNRAILRPGVQIKSECSSDVIYVR